MSLQLQTAIVRIFNMKSVVVGTGFLVEESIVLTCAHVVAGALGISEKELKWPDESIFLDFPLLAAGERCTARVRSWHPVQENGGGDIAVLQVEGPLPDGARGVRLVAANDLWGHTFRAFGFPQAHDSGVWASGRLLAGEATGWIQIEDIKITGKRVQQGFSGGAVWDEQLDGVVGMIVAADEDSSKVAYLVPTKSLLEQVPALDHSAIPPCPYRGLSAFREQDAPYFFGRTAFIQQLVSKVSKRSLVAITGPSGSGKSSVLSAGLIPHLRREGIWLIASFRLGSSPFRSLAAALLPLLEPHLSGTARLVETNKLSRSLQQGEISLKDVIESIIENNDRMRLLIAIDQFEELYAPGQEPVICRRFLDELLNVVHMSPVEAHTCSIAFTLRSDFLGQVLSYPPIAQALQDATLKISPMSREELENAIIQPAQKLNVKTEDGLVRRILQDMSQQQDYYLPLLSFALQLLWAKQKSNKLTHAAYTEIGGVEKVIADYAEEIYAGLSEEEQLKAQQVFVQLVRPGVGTEDSRRLASRTEIGEVNWQLVMRLSSTARLLVIGRDEITGEETVEVIHEALILNWWRLREWIEKNREFRTWQESLRTAMRRWEKVGRDDALLHGELLDNAIDWLTKHKEIFSPQERIFIEASQRGAQVAEEKIEIKPLPASSRRIPKRKAGQVSPSSQEIVPSPEESAITVTRTFIGREEELMQLEEWLTRTDPEAPWIMYVHDALEDRAKKGGVGKTWLLRQFAQRVRMTHPDIVTVPIDFFNIADREGVAVADRVVNALKAAYPQWTPRVFDETLMEYRSRLQGGKENAGEVRDRLADALTVDLRSLDKQLQEKRTYLLVLCDTYELIEQNPTTAVLGSSQTFPDNYQFGHMRVVIAGRNALDWTHPNWKGRSHEAQTIALSPFGQEEMQVYVEMESTYGISLQGKQAKELYERTEGRPILIGLAIDVLNHRILTLDDLLVVPRTDFESYLISQINNLEDPLSWIVLFMAHGYQRFNMSILQWILRSSPALSELTESINSEKLLKKLSELSFVRRSSSGNDFVLHDEMQRLVRKYCWDVQDPALNIRKEISRSVISYYDQEITQAQDEQQRQAYIIELLYHRLFIDRADGMRYFQQCFQKALDLWQIPFARVLFQEIAKYENDTYLTLAQRNDIAFAEARLLLSEDDAIRALDLYQDLELEADTHWIKDYQADILLEKGKCYVHQGNYLDAAASFIQSLEFEKIQSKWPQRPVILGWLGYSHYLRGQFELALGYYEESVALLRESQNAYEYANVHAGMSLVYRLQGNTSEALRICKLAWRIYTDLSRRGQKGEIAVGFSLITMGQIYLDLDNIMQAERCFQDAFSIYNRIGRKKGLIATYNCFGQIQMAKGDLQQAHQWFEKAQGAFSRIDIHIDISNLNKQARILIQQGRWRESLLFFEQAIHLAWQTYDDYQRTENLIGLAEAAAALGQKQRTVQLLHEAEEIAHRWNYLRFLGLVEEIRGNISYKAREYQAAFIHYSQFCHYMARYSLLAYYKALGKIIDCLFDMPRDDTCAIIDSCIAYWQSHNLDNLYPDFVVALEEQRTLLAF